MELMLAAALIVSSVLMESLCPNQDSLPTAEDAQFLRKQVRNPSWEKIYKGINRAIQNREGSFEFHFHSDDPKIPISEIKEELESLGYTVNKLYYTLPNNCDFVVKW